MVLNYIWIAFFVIAFLIALVKLIFMGDTSVFPAMMDSTFTSSKTAFEISIGLTGVLALWLGIMKIGERGGVVNLLAKMLAPVFSKLFPDIPKGHPATGSIFMNIAANMLGLDNAATPLGLKAMQAMRDEHGILSGQASPDMMTFVVINTASLQLLPTTLLTLRAEAGAADPMDIMPCVWLTSAAALTAGLLLCGALRGFNGIGRAKEEH